MLAFSRARRRFPLTIPTALVMLLVLSCIYIGAERENERLVSELLSAPGQECVNNVVYEKDSRTDGVGHVYRSFAHARFIVLTYNRPLSLGGVLHSLQEQELDGHTGSVHIWIDRSPSGEVHNQTLSVASAFCWDRGATTVHVHSKHVGLHGQWMNTWDPPPEGATTPGGRSTQTLAIMLEDDEDISPFAYRWLRAAHVRYGGRRDVFGYGLQDENVIVARGERQYREISREDKQLVFGYVIPGTWGLAPHPGRWKEAGQWFRARSRTPGFRPLTEGADMYNTWYLEAQARNRTEQLVSLWLARFAHERHLVTLFTNLPHVLGRADTSLVLNRREAGVHFTRKGGRLRVLMKEWQPASLKLPDVVNVFGYDGSRAGTISFN